MEHNPIVLVDEMSQRAADERDLGHRFAAAPGVGGGAATARMIALHGAIKRLRPTDHDWNDMLQSHQ